MQIKTRELEGAALDWAVAKALGGEFKPHRFAANEDARLHDAWVFPSGYAATQWKPSTNWSQGGSLIDRYKAEFRLRMNEGLDCRIEIWDADGFGYDEIKQPGPTHLIAAMRAIVAAELGDVVEVPDELTEAPA